MSSVTFGSVGDIIAVCLLAKSIVEALDDSRGSSAEYQGLVTELRSLECSLLEGTKLFTRSWRNSSTSASIQRECSKLITECRNTLEAFQMYLKKYDSSLSKDTRTGILRRAGAKIKWQLLAKDTVARFRSELAGHSNALNMMMITANLMVSLGSFDAQTASASSTERSLADQSEELATLRSEIRNNSVLASSMNSVVRTMSQQITWFTNLLNSVKSMLSQGLRLNLATYRAVLSIQESLGHSMDRTLIQDPFVLEDPLGRVAPVHLQFITSWKAFHAVLVTRFQGLPGHKKIEQWEFVIQEKATNREISGNEPWETAFRPGALVLMSLVFQRDVKTADSKSHCPYCGNISESETAADVHCMKCGMIYRRVTEVIEVDQPTTPGLPNYWNQQPSFGRSGFSDPSPVMGPFLKRKRSMQSWEELSLSEEVRSFKRVRILSNVKKARKAAFDAWEEKSSWDVPESERIDTGAFDDRFGAKSASTADVDVGTRNLFTKSIILSSASFLPRNQNEPWGESVFAHTLDSAEDDTSGSEQDMLECGPFPSLQANEFVGLYKAPAKLFQLPDTSDYCEFNDGNIDMFVDVDRIIVREHYEHRLNAGRAQLLQFLPGGPILAPIPERPCQVMDIGSSNAWPLMAMRYMPKAQITHVQTRDHHSSRDLLSILGMHGAEKYDLIHMQDWTVSANYLPDLPRALWQLLRPGGWIEIEILELRVQGDLLVELQILPFVVCHSFRTIGIGSFSTAEGITESLEQAYFTRVQSSVARIPINGPSEQFDGQVLENHFRELLLLVFRLAANVATLFKEPVRSNRLSVIKKVRGYVCGGLETRTNFMNLVRIKAQKPVGKPDGQ